MQEVTPQRPPDQLAALDRFLEILLEMFRAERAASALSSEPLELSEAA
jgi:hypothetical protein